MFRHVVAATPERRDTSDGPSMTAATQETAATTEMLTRRHRDERIGILLGRMLSALHATRLIIRFRAHCFDQR